MTKVKICGLTNAGDALAAAEAGADFLGFVFAPSPRRLDPARAREFWRDLPPGVPRVGVFRDQALEEVERVLALVHLDFLQFHGDERPAFCRAFGIPVIRAIPARRAGDLDRAAAYEDCAALFLVDLPKEETSEGTLAGEVARRAASLGRPVLLAGGLTPENVGALVREFRPYGVDVARGVESAPGVKDRARVRAFIANAKGTEQPLAPGGVRAGAGEER